MGNHTEHDNRWQCSDVDALLEAGKEFSLEEAMNLYLHLHICQGACGEHVLEKMESGEMSKLFGAEVTQAKNDGNE